MTNYILLCIYFVLLTIWSIILFANSNKYKHMIEPLDSKQYMLKALYPIGFGLLGMVRYSFNTILDKKRLAQARIVYGEKYAEYYYRVNVAEKVTYVSIGIVLAPLFGVLLNDPMLCLAGVFVAGVAFYYADSKITDIIQAREIAVTKDFCDMVSKMALLINAGMITREAWEQIAVNGEGTLYMEMQNATLDMQNGMSEVDAYLAFSNRCGVPFVTKFISMLAQNLSKGNKELVDFLKAETKVCWEEKKHIVKRQGEQAASKLMIPLGMILIGIFVMILLPVVANMGL